MLKQASNIFFIGIGGIGVSGLARILQAKGKNISGSDILKSGLTDSLESEGVSVKIGHTAKNLPPETELAVYSPAVPEDNPERKKAKQLGIPQLAYPEALGKLLADYYYVIAVAGTNGKTSTTAMLARVLEQAGLDPTVLVGSLMTATGKNIRVGESKYFVLEADEYKRGFLNYNADLAVITNIAADHLDYFKDETDVKQAFAEFISQIKPNGYLVYNLEDPNTVETAGRFEGEKTGFLAGDFKLQVPGRFYQMNASAAAAAARVLGVEEEKIRSALKSFVGAWRRFEKVGEYQDADVISDYAHHPAGVRAVLETASEAYAGKKVLAVYQPHQHNRTKKLFDDFIQSFCESRVSDFVMAEIFDVAGREEDKDQDVSSEDLVKKLQTCGKNVQYAADLDAAERMIRDTAVNYDAVLIIGAGDIYLVAERLIKSHE